VDVEVAVPEAAIKAEVENLKLDSLIALTVNVNHIIKRNNPRLWKVKKLKLKLL
jgi:hypothetical protein